MIQFSDIPYELSRIQEADFDLIRDTARGVYVEVGTLYGASAYAATQNSNAVYTIDIYDWQPKVYEDKDVTFFLN